MDTPATTSSVTATPNLTAKDIKRLHTQSIIFEDYDRPTISTRPSTAVATNKDNARVIKTFQDSNIFGWKDSSSASLTTEAKKALNSNASSKARDIPTFNKSNITEHTFNEEQERKRQEWKDKRKGIMATGTNKEEDPEKWSVKAPTNVAFSKKLQEIQGNANENPNIEARDIEALKKANKLHASNAKWSDTATQRKFAHNKNIQQESFSQYASIRKNVELHSDIFHANEEIERNNISVDQGVTKQSPTKKPTDFTDKHNENIRRKDQRYSDIFGSEQFIKHNEKFTSNPTKHIHRLATKVDWKDSATEHMVKNPGKKDLNPTQMKLDQLATSVTFGFDQGTKDGNNIADPDVATPTNNIGKGLAKYGKSKTQEDLPIAPTKLKTNAPETLEFDLKNLPKNMDEESLKKLCKGFQVLEYKSDSGKNNGKILGAATLKVRNEKSGKILELKNRLKSEGIVVSNRHDQPKNIRN